MLLVFHCLCCNTRAQPYFAVLYGILVHVQQRGLLFGCAQYSSRSLAKLDDYASGGGIVAVAV